MTRHRYRRLVEVACRRLARQTWREVAEGMGWRTAAAARSWSRRWISRWEGQLWMD